MRAVLAVAFCSVVAAACAEGNPQYTGDGSVGDPIGGGSTALDGGSDGGDAGTDGGADAGDAGCTAASFNTTYVTDNCFVFGAATTATVFVDGTTCDTTVFVEDGLNCSGKATNAANGFDGGCNTTLACTSNSLPGTMTCHANGGSCIVQICDPNDNCPP
jgi:hypothetical protein